MSVEQNNAVESWLKFLNPRSLKSNLISASLYLAAWETFEHGVIGHLEGFYFVGFDQDGDKFSDDYKADVLSRDKSRFKASMLWFKEHNVIDDADLALADRARQHRNDIAHNLPSYISKASHNVDVELLSALCDLQRKIDVWWVVNVEVATDPDFCDKEIDESRVQSGGMMFLYMMLKIATGEDEEASHFYREFVKISGQQKTPAAEPLHGSVCRRDDSGGE